VATLTSSSTEAEAWAAYHDNVGYDEDSSASMAKAFRTALRWLIANPSSAGKGDERYTRDINALREELREVNAWVQLNDTTTNAGVRHFDLRGFRT